MARETDLGPRSRVDPGGRANRRPFGGTNIKPRTEVPANRRRAKYSRAQSPVGIMGSRGTRRRSRFGRRYSR